MSEFTYEQLLWKQSSLVYTIQDLRNDMKLEKDKKKLKSMQEEIENCQKEFEDVCLMLDNGEFIKDDMWYEEKCSSDLTNGEILERIEACYDY
jgi:hypothetical protein